MVSVTAPSRARCHSRRRADRGGRCPRRSPPAARRPPRARLLAARAAPSRVEYPAGGVTSSCTCLHSEALAPEHVHRAGAHVGIGAPTRRSLAVAGQRGAEAGRPVVRVGSDGAGRRPGGALPAIADHGAGHAVDPRRADQRLGCRRAGPQPRAGHGHLRVGGCEPRLLAPGCRSAGPEDERLCRAATGSNRGSSRPAPRRPDQGALPIESQRGAEPVAGRGGRGLDDPARRPLAGTLPAPKTTTAPRSPSRPGAPASSTPPWSATDAPSRSPSAPPGSGEPGPLAPASTRAALEHVHGATAGSPPAPLPASRLPSAASAVPNPSPSTPSFALSIPLLHPAGPRSRRKT